MRFWKLRDCVQYAGALLNFTHAIYAEGSYAASAWTLEKAYVSNVHVGEKVLRPAQEIPEY